MKNDETLSLGERTAVRLPLLMLIGLLASIAGATLAWATLRGDVGDHTKTLTTHEERIKRLEESQADLAVIRNDVQWIRRTIEQQPRAKQP